MKLIIGLVLFVPVIAFAQYDPSYPPSPVGHPLPDSGVQVIPLSKMYNTESARNNNTQRLQELRTKGYINSEEPYINYLFSVKHKSVQEIKAFKGNNDPYDTHLKSSISEIKLAFPYNGISFIEPDNIIGFAAIGAYKNGWTGVKEFFKDNDLDVCEFSKSNRTLDHGGVQIAAEYARYDINSKPNVLNIVGNHHTGFLYTIEWYDDKFNNTLVCANKSYSQAIEKKLIAYATRIDQDKNFDKKYI